MIDVSVHIADGLTRIDVDGHEGHVADGRVCAAISAVVNAAVLGLEHIAEEHPEIVRFQFKEN